MPRPKPQRAGGTPALPCSALLPRLLCGSQALFERLHFTIMPSGRWLPKWAKCSLINGTSASQPSMSTLSSSSRSRGLHIQSFGVEISCLGNPSDGSFVGMHLAVAALKDPFQDAAVFTVAGPQELAVLSLFLSLFWRNQLT